MSHQWELWENFWIHDKTTVKNTGCVEIEKRLMKVKMCVFCILLFFFHQTKPGVLRTTPRSDGAQRWRPVQHWCSTVPCAFNQLAEMESDESHVRERLASSSPLSPEELAKLVGTVAWAALTFLGLWLTHYLLFVVKFSWNRFLFGLSAGLSLAHTGPFFKRQKESLHQNILLPSVEQL